MIPFKETHGWKCSKGKTMTRPRHHKKKDTLSNLNSSFIKDHDLTKYVETVAKLSSPTGSSKTKKHHKVDEKVTSNGSGSALNKVLQADNKENMLSPRAVDSTQKKFQLLMGCRSRQSLQECVLLEGEFIILKMARLSTRCVCGDLSPFLYLILHFML